MYASLAPTSVVIADPPSGNFAYPVDAVAAGHFDIPLFWLLMEGSVLGGDVLISG